MMAGMETTSPRPLNLEWTLGQRIEQARTRAGYARPEDLSPVIGASARAIRNWENDENVPSVATIREIARLTGAPEEFLMASYTKKPRRAPGGLAVRSSR